MCYNVEVPTMPYRKIIKNRRFVSIAITDNAT